MPQHIRTLTLPSPGVARNFAAFAALALSTSSVATTYYVSTTGNNANAGTTIAAPLRTIDYAVNHVNPGDKARGRGG